MFGSLGFTEIAFILVLALLLFGPKRLPEIGRTLGKGLAEFRKASNDLRRTLESEVALDEAQKRPTPPSVQARPTAVPAPTSPNVAPVGDQPATSPAETDGVAESTPPSSESAG